MADPVLRSSNSLDPAVLAACDSTGSVERLGTRTLAVIGLVFCLGGVPALVYQMAWQRILALHSGVGIYSVAMIVAAFMAGLGVGSYLGGIVSRSLRPVAALRGYAVIELGIGLFGLISAPLYYDLLYLEAAWLGGSAWRIGLGHFIALLIPTGLMGMSLPVLVKAAVRRLETAGPTIGYLYGLNVLGAAFGAVLAPWVLVRFWGVRGAILIAAACNVLAGISAWVVSSHRSFRNLPSELLDAPPPVHAVPVASRHWFSTWLLLYGLCGFTGLALEMVWFRVCDVAAKSTAFTFGTVLGVYLFGLAGGSLVGTMMVNRVTRPLRAFLICQCAILAYAGLAITLLVHSGTVIPGMGWLAEYWRGYDGVVPGDSALTGLVLFYVVLPVVLFAPPTALMGFAFCVLQRAVHDDRQTSGFKVGVLQAANIAGCVAGSLLVGLVTLTLWGTGGTLRMLVACGFVFVMIGIYHFGWRSVFVPLAAALALVVALLPSTESLWFALHGYESASKRWGMVAEDATGVVAILPEGQGVLRVSVDGKGHSWLPFGSIHSYLGALPAVLHPEPKRVAIIGLGSGDTAWAAACRPETEQITVFELCGPQERLLRRLAGTVNYPQLHRFLADPRVRIEVADGRNALTVQPARYDVIEADASRPQSGYSGNLYSIEFFQLCLDRLERGGIMCTWAPTPRVYTTFCSVFPHVIEWNGGEILFGSNEPLTIDIPSWQQRARSAPIAYYLGPAVAEGLVDYLRSARPAAPPVIRGLEPNRDLFPRDEFRSPH